MYHHLLKCSNCRFYSAFDWRAQQLNERKKYDIFVQAWLHALKLLNSRLRIINKVIRTWASIVRRSDNLSNLKLPLKHISISSLQFNGVLIIYKYSFEIFKIMYLAFEFYFVLWYKLLEFFLPKCIPDVYSYFFREKTFKVSYG